MTRETKIDAAGVPAAAAADADADDEIRLAQAPPCDVLVPKLGCCGQGRSWIWYPVHRLWLCVPRPGCPQ